MTFLHPLINGLSDHDGQIITFSSIAKSVPRHLSSNTREINRHTIQNFTLLLSYENWEDVFFEKDVNTLVGYCGIVTMTITVRHI